MMTYVFSHNNIQFFTCTNSYKTERKFDVFTFIWYNYTMNGRRLHVN